MAGGSASALSLSGPAQALLTLRPAGSLSRPRRPLSRGSDLLSYPGKSLVSFRINRQLSGWNPPPQVIRAFGAHDPNRTFTGRALLVLVEGGPSAGLGWRSDARSALSATAEPSSALGSKAK